MPAHEAPSTATSSLTEVRSNLSEVIDEIERTGGDVVITRHGRSVAVLLAYDEYESLIETVNILSDAETMDAVARGEAEFASSDFVRLDEV